MCAERIFERSGRRVEHQPELLADALELGEGRDRGACGARQLVVNLQQERLVGLDDEGSVGHLSIVPRRAELLLVAVVADHDAGRAMDLAELVYNARTEAGLTQTQLAAAMGTSQSAVASWENGARIPGIDALERLAAACGKRLHIAITAA